jgi:hypothetical protein
MLGQCVATEPWLLVSSPFRAHRHALLCDHSCRSRAQPRHNGAALTRCGVAAPFTSCWCSTHPLHPPLPSKRPPPAAADHVATCAQPRQHPLVAPGEGFAATPWCACRWRPRQPLRALSLAAHACCDVREASPARPRPPLHAGTCDAQAPAGLQQQATMVTAAAMVQPLHRASSSSWATSC